jgi:predicted nucleic acid-binding protein
VTILVDTDVLVSFINRSESRHKQAADLMGRAWEGAWGAPITTDFVLDEALTLLMARGARLELADRLLRMALEPMAAGASSLLPIVRVSDRAFAAAIPLFRRHFRRGLSFTDCTSLAVMAEREVSLLASFDRGFDGLAARAAL